MNITRVEVTPKQGAGLSDVRGNVVRRQLMADHNINVGDVRSIVGFLISSSIESADISARVDDLFADPIIEYSCTDQLFIKNTELFAKTPDAVISVGFKAGVTDNPGAAALDGFRTIFPNTDLESKISTYITYIFYDLPKTVTTDLLAGILHNQLIQRAILQAKKTAKTNYGLKLNTLLNPNRFLKIQNTSPLKSQMKI